MKKYLELRDISAYRIVFDLSNYVWDIVINKKDKVNFYRYSYGSIDESFDWTEKANKRVLLKEKEYHHVIEELKKLPREINHLINFTNEKLSI